MSQNQIAVTPEIAQMIDHLNVQLLKKMKDAVFSPFSILYVMLLVYLGADGQTRQEMQKTLNINLNDSQLIVNLGRLKRMFDSCVDCDVKIINSNALILKSGFPIEKNYTDILCQVSGAQLMTFKDINDAVIKTNNWVSDQTFDLIPKLLNQNDVDPLTRLILVNVIYFHAKWEYPFEKNRTYPDQFYGLTSIKTLNFMHKTHHYRYFEDLNMQYIELPYTSNSGSEYSLMIALPKNREDLGGNSPLIPLFSQPFCVSNRKRVMGAICFPDLDWKFEKIQLSLPQFEHRHRLDLVNIFKQLGIQQLFTQNANLQFIASKENLLVSKILHEAVVKVDEEGIEAAAATAVVATRTMASRPHPPKKVIIMNVNHQFYYSIIRRYNNQHYILFNGICDG